MKNYIALVLDTSSSMGVIREEARQVYNSILDTIRERSRDEDQETFVSIIEFNSVVRLITPPTEVRNLQNIDRYNIGGMTALFDGVGLAVQTLEEYKGKDNSYLVMTFTDGEENCSFRYRNPKQFNQLLEVKQNSGDWTFSFQLPPGRRQGFCSKFGIPIDNVREWETTVKGIEEVRQSTQKAVSNYFTARGTGQRAVKNFYQDVSVDLAKVSAKDIKDLTDLSANFKVLKVDKEYDIKTFIEEKTKKNYVIGSCYYQLTKSEKIQPTKNILLREKGKKTIYGGREARELIGLPTDGSHARVKVVDTSKYEIFCASTSTNRKLVRGTSVLLDKNKKVAEKPTWEPSV